MAAGSEPKLVWYSSFGSNLSRERFECYLVGGKTAGMAFEMEGARDKTLPRDDAAWTLPFELHFGRESSLWGGGVAFVGHTVVPNGTSEEAALPSAARSRMYLITEEQFEDVVAQENGGRGTALDLDLATLTPAADSGAADVPVGRTFDESRWYGRIVYCGTKDGHPILTFTAPSPEAEMEGELNAPGPAYAQVVASGLMESHNLSIAAVVKYLAACPGIRGVLSESDVLDLLLPDDDANVFFPLSLPPCGKAEVEANLAPFVYHLVPASAWDDAETRPDEPYYPPTFEADGGFIHCCRIDDIKNVLNHYFTSVTEDVVTVKIDVATLSSKLVFEDPAPVGTRAAHTSTRLMPHIYGHINTEAVVDVFTCTRHEDGTYDQVTSA